MGSLIERLLAAHRMLSRELRRESRRRHPDAARIARLRAERAAVKARVSRHWPWPSPGRAIVFVRAVLDRLLRPAKRNLPRTGNGERP